MNKCIKGKQFWCKQCIHEQGTCMACPPNWKSCYNERIDDQKRCVDSCRTAKTKPAKPKTKTAKKTSTSILPTIPTSSAFFPSGLRPTPSKPVAYRSVLHPGEAKKSEPRPANNGDHHIKVDGLIVGVSVLSVVALLAIVVSLVFLRRKIRKRSRRNRAETEGIAEECVGLNVITPNEVREENSPANDVETDLQSNDEEQEFEANGIEEGQAPQETQPPVHAPPPSSIRVGGTQETEEDNCSSCLHLNEVHN